MSIIKLNWGTRIAFLYGGFVVLIVILVAGSMRQSFDLVTPDYYSQEIKYQDVINADKNLSALSDKVNVTVEQSQIVLSFPKEFEGKSITGNVLFYSPVNSAWDKKMNLAMNDNRMTVSKSLLNTTSYTLKLSWQADGKQYYQEAELNIAK